MYRVLLVDDQLLFREIARTMLDAAGGFEVAAEAMDGAEAVGLYGTVAPDLVLMDVQMPHMNGFEAARRIVNAHPGAAVALMSMRREPEYSQMAIEAGALVFVPKRDLDVTALKAILDDRMGSAASRAA
jgi:DNA-binding NarL/FixJ family response regulator